jgi:hypothetical protein
MATILGLAMKISADATGVQQSLTPVERALNSLSEQAEKSAAAFRPLARESSAAAEAQQRTLADFAALTEELRNGLDFREYAARFKELQLTAEDTAAAFAEGAKITAQYRSEEEKRAVQIERITRLQEQGAITEEIAARAKDDALGAGAAAAKAEQQRAEAVADAARIIRANLTPQERYDQQIQELNDHLREGRLSQEQFNRAAAKASQDLDRAGKSAGDADKNIERLNRNVSLLTKLEIGRAIVDGLQVLSRTFTSAASQITSLVTSVNSSLDTLNDFSARTGIGVEALQGYSLAAKLAGVDTEAFGSAVQKLAVNIGKATPGGELDKALKGLNLSVAELRALAPEQQFSTIGAAISQLPTAAERAAAAVQVFGKQGAALAPLFREGADSLEELRARAERLGIIVNETQISNVAEMNDGFDLVRATVEGIIGQVVGNLAPAVTGITEEFLRFVEEFAGAEGQGGTGIANAITDVLLNGAEFLAGVFDQFVSNFGGFSGALESAGGVFSTVADVFTAVSETLRVAFNAFELVGNSLALRLGQVLEGIGSYLNDELEAAGRALVASSQEAIDSNAAELVNAAEGVGNAVSGVFGGDRAEAAAQGAGQAETFLQGIRERIERERSPQFRVETNIEETRDRFDVFFGGIVDQSSVVTDAMRQFEAVVASVEDPLNMTAEEIKRIEEAQRRVNDLINTETADRQKASEAATKQAEEDRKRVDGLLKAGDDATKVQQDIQSVAREIARVQGEQAAARQDNLAAEADAATARLAQLDQLQAKLQEQQQAAEQGFGEGFKKAFEQIDKTIVQSSSRAAEFGDAGFRAYQRLQEGVAVLQQQARDGILNKEALDAEVAKLQDLFEQQLQGAANVNDLLFQQLSGQDQQRAIFFQQQEERRAQAVKNLAAIEEEIAATKAAVEKAREDGDLKAAKAATDRLRQLGQLLNGEKEIAAGRQQQQQGFTQDQTAQREQFAKAQDEQYKQALQQQQQLLAERAKAEQAEFARQSDRIRELNTLGSRTVNTADVRTQEGQDLVLGLAANAQDPALIEARLQTKQLQLIAQGISQAAGNYFNTPVAIVGGARLGGFG